MLCISEDNGSGVCALPPQRKRQAMEKDGKMPFRDDKNKTDETPKSVKSARNKWLDLLMAATVGFFLISCVTGVMLLCGVGKGIVKDAHEWLSVGLVVAGLIHAIRHWSIIGRYARSVTFWGAAVIVLVLATAFVAPALNRGGGGPGGPGGHGGPAKGMGAVIQTLESASVTSAASLVNTTPEALVSRLREAGLTVAGPEQTLREVAQSSGKDIVQVMEIIASK